MKHQDRAKQTPVMYAARQDFDLRAAMVHAAEQEELRRRALKKFGRPAPSRRHSSGPTFVGVTTVVVAGALFPLALGLTGVPGAGRASSGAADIIRLP